MDCPRCSNHSPDQDRCLACGWQRELEASDPDDRGAPAFAVAGEIRVEVHAARAAGDSNAGSDVAGVSELREAGNPSASAADDSDGRERVEDGDRSTEADNTRDREDASTPVDDTRFAAAVGRIESHDVKTIAVLSGERVVYAEVAQFLGDDGRSREPSKSVSLVDTTSEFRFEPHAARLFDAAEVQPHALRLRHERVLLVSCVAASIQRAAVSAVVGAVDLPTPQVRLLGFGGAGGEQPFPTLGSLLDCIDVDGAETLIVADGVAPGGESFLDSILNKHGAYTVVEIRHRLEQRNAMLVCLIGPLRQLARTPDDTRSLACWAVPVLDPFLRREFAIDAEKLRQKITEQRAAGSWSEDDGNFWHQLLRHWTEGNLLDVIAAGGPPSAKLLPEPSDERPVDQAVLFTGTFFPGLNPREFDQVVSTLLRDALPVTAPGPRQEGTDANAPHTAAIPAQDFWRSRSDRFQKECGLVLLADGDAPATLNFAEPGEGARLRRRFKREFPFYLDGRFLALHAAGLLFAPSNTIATSLTRLTADVVGAFPDVYGADWVAGLARTAPVAGPVSSRLLARRTGELLRELWTPTRTRDVAEATLDRLIGAREFELVLELVKRLRLVDGFGWLRWLRQLVERGGEDARSATSRFLHRELITAGRRVYPLLHAVSQWLPAPGRDVASVSNQLALRLLVEYAADTVARFDRRAYGEWPSPYPLFAPGDGAAAPDLALVVTWLLHPAMPDSIRGNRLAVSVPSLTAALIAEWTFILLGAAPSPAERAGSEDPCRPESESELMFFRLLAEVAACAAQPGRAALCAALQDHWSTMEAHLGERPGLGCEAREELAWKRRLLRFLGRRFRSLVATSRASAHAAQSS